MNDWNDLHKLNEMKAPQALKERTLEAIQQSASKEKKGVQKMKRKVISAVAGLAACLIVLVNVSPAAALGLGSLPVIGALVRVITLRSDIYQTDDSTVSVDVPQVQGQDTQRVNELIQQQVAAYEARAQADIQVYKQAFLQTGGTEAEFAAKDIQVKVDYEVKSQTTDIVSFVLTGSQNWSASTVERYYYNLRLSDGSVVTLQDLLGDDWVAKANGQIVAQIEAHNRQNELDYFIPEHENGFRTVDENTKFYINEDGKPVVVFAKYEIGPGTLGEPEFVLDFN